MPDVIFIDEKWLAYANLMPAAVSVPVAQFRAAVEAAGGELIEQSAGTFYVEVEGGRSNLLMLPAKLTWRLLAVNNDSVTMAPVEIPGLYHNDSSRILAALGLTMHDVALPFKAAVMPTPEWDAGTALNADGATVLAIGFLHRLLDQGILSKNDLLAFLK